MCWSQLIKKNGSISAYSCYLLVSTQKSEQRVGIVVLGGVKEQRGLLTADKRASEEGTMEKLVFLLPWRLLSVLLISSGDDEETSAPCNTSCNRPAEADGAEKDELPPVFALPVSTNLSVIGSNSSPPA